MNQAFTPGMLIQYNDTDTFYLVVNTNDSHQMDVIRTAVHESYVARYVPCSISKVHLAVLK